MSLSIMFAVLSRFSVVLLPLAVCAIASASDPNSRDSAPSLDCPAGNSAEECFGSEAGLNLLQTKALKRSASAARITIEPSVAVPRGFVVKGRTPKTQMMTLSFFVKQQNLDDLETALLNVSDPDSAAYGKHLSNTQVQDLVAPKEEHLDSVMDHLQSFDIQPWRATQNGDVLMAHVSAEQAEELLQTKFETVSHVKTGHVMHRCLGGYTLPHHVAHALDFVSPTVHLMSPPPPLSSMQPHISRKSDRSKEHSKASETSGSGLEKRPSSTFEPPVPTSPPLNMKTTTTTTTTLPYNNSGVCPDGSLYPTRPKDLRTLYSVAGTVGQDPHSKQAVTGFIGQTYNLQQLKDYWSIFCHGIMCGQGDPGNVGDDTLGTNKVEAMLDVDVITGVAGNIYTEFWGFDSPDSESDPFVAWLIKAASTSDEVIPKIFSTSYGEDENAYSAVAAQRLNVEFMKMGARGISILFASGDEGANLENKTFAPESPGSSPYVTAVGATAPTKGFPHPGSETATALSSGGFSNYWKRPSWQDKVVNAYLKTPGLRLPNVTKYGVETKGRAYPDIAAQGYSFCVTPDFVGDVFGCQVGGTSAASPTASGIFSLLNDLRSQQGKSPLGFLNPLIYKFREAFYDVTIGYNTLDGNCSSAPAWPAAKGWDPVTGVGTPNYAKLAAIVSDLP